MSKNLDIDKIKLIIDGRNFNNIEGFYKEASKVFTGNSMPIANLDQLNDVLGGGYGIFDISEQPITVVWKNHEKSKKDLSYGETLKYLKEKLRRCHPSWKKQIKEDIESAQNQKGKTFFDYIVELIETEETGRITLVLE